MAGRKLIFVLLLLCVSFGASAQVEKLEIGISRHSRLFTRTSGFDPGPNGSSFYASLTFPVINEWKLQSGLVLGANGIGNYSGINLGIQYIFPFSLERIQISTALQGMIGAVFFQQKAIFIHSIQTKFQFAYNISRGTQLFLYASPAYIVSPQYKEYSPVNAYLDLDFGLGVCFLLFPE